MSSAPVDFRVVGLADLKCAIDEMEKSVRNKGIRKALRAGANVVRRAEIAAAPNMSGATRKAIKVRAAKRRPGRISVLCQVGAGWFVGTEYYAGFVEWGHKIGKRTAEVKRTMARISKMRRRDAAAADVAQAELDTIDKRTRVPAKLWFTKAFKASAEAAAQKVEQVLREQIEAAAANKGKLPEVAQ